MFVPVVMRMNGLRVTGWQEDDIRKSNTAIMDVKGNVDHRR